MGLFDFLKKTDKTKDEQAAKAKEDEERKRREEEQRRERMFVDSLDAIPAVKISIAEKPAKKLTVAAADEMPFSNITKKTPRDKLGDFVVFDVETTGIQPSTCEIVEIAAIRFRDWKPVEKFTTLCKPRKGIKEDAARVNGITEEMTEGMPEFGRIAQAFVDFVGSDAVVGHNLGFDLRFVVKHGADLTATRRKYYDTLDLAERTLKKMKWKWDREMECNMPDLNSDFDVEDYKLGTLCRHYQIPFYGSHRALADCYVTSQLLYCLAKDRE